MRHVGTEIRTWLPKPQAATFIVAASDSLHKERADYVCDGTADEVEIQAAIDTLINGGEIVLLEGIYNVDVLNITKSVTIRGMGGYDYWSGNEGTLITHTGSANCINLASGGCGIRNLKIRGTSNSDYLISISGDYRHIDLSNLGLEGSAADLPTAAIYMSNSLYNSSNNIGIRYCATGIILAAASNLHTFIDIDVAHCTTGINLFGLSNGNNFYGCGLQACTTGISLDTISAFTFAGGWFEANTNDVVFTGTVKGVFDRNYYLTLPLEIPSGVNVRAPSYNDITIIRARQTQGINDTFYIPAEWINVTGTVVTDTNAYSGKAVELDAQEEYVRVLNTKLMPGTYSFIVRAKDTNQVGTDLQVLVKNDTDVVNLLFKAITQTAEYKMFMYTFIIDDDDWDDYIRFQITKRTATANTISVDFVAVYPQFFNRQFTDLFMDVIAVSATHVVNAQACHVDPTTLTVGAGIAAQPDVPRTLSWVVNNAGGITAADITITGIDAKGNSISEAFDLTGGLTGETNNAFATVSEVKIENQVNAAAGDTISVGITDVLGLSNIIYATSDVYKIKKNNADAVVAAAQVNTTYHTYDMTVIGLAATNDFTIWFKSNLNIIS